MAVYDVDAAAAIELARRGYASTGVDRELYAPTLLRSQVLTPLHTELLAGVPVAAEMLELAERACRLPRRLLGDPVLGETAWLIATERGRPETVDGFMAGCGVPR